MDLEIPGFHYNRINNPTVDVLESRLAALEGGTGAMAVSSGAAAVAVSVLNIVSAGGNLVSVPQLYGATYTYFAHVLPRFGIEMRFPSDDSAESIAALIDEHTQAVFCETVGNPAGNVIDLAAVTTAAHDRGVPVIADNTVPTPLVLKPFEYGADVVIHSLTKLVGGHGTTLGGVVVDAGTFPGTSNQHDSPDCSSPSPRFMACVSRPISPRTHTSLDAGRSDFGTPVRHCRRSTRFSCSKASRRCHRDSPAMKPTPERSRTF